MPFKKGNKCGSLRKNTAVSEKTRRKISNTLKQKYKNKQFKETHGFQSGHEFIEGVEKGWFEKGHTPWNTGKKRVGFIPPNKKPTIYFCKQCNKILIDSPSSNRKFCSKKCMNKFLRDYYKGENNPHWKGGYISDYGKNWNTQRLKALKRDKFTCRLCGDGENRLDIHHIKPFRLFELKRYIEANDLSNLITLCVSCHTKIEHNPETLAVSL